MVSKLVILATFVLAAAAAGDALRGVGGAERPSVSGGGVAEEATREPTRLVGPRATEFRAEGNFLRNRILRSGREYLSREAVARAFPVRVEGPLDISKVAVAPDGTLVLAVYRFPADRAAQGALELWRGRTLVSAFPVPPGYFGGGLAFNRDGSLIATFSYDGQLRGVFDRNGRRLERLPTSFLYVD